jgi:ribosomal protein S18 acetylase RimI-like enzyme
MVIASLGYRTDLMLLGLQGSVFERRAGYQVIRTPANPTFHWGNFLLLDRPPAPGTVSSWTSTFAREFPGAEHVAIGVDGTSGDAGDEAELAAAGLEADHNAVLTAAATTPPPRPNEVAQFRMLDCDADWEAALDLQQAVHPYGDPEGWDGFNGLRLLAMRQMQAQGFGAWFGAFQAGQMVSGLGVFGDSSGVVRFQNVDTHPGHRNQGLAGTLVHNAGQYAQQEMAAKTQVIVADQSGTAVRIYRSVGFRDAEAQVQLQRRQPD